MMLSMVVLAAAAHAAPAAVEVVFMASPQIDVVSSMPLGNVVVCHHASFTLVHLCHGVSQIANYRTRSVEVLE